MLHHRPDAEMADADVERELAHAHEMRHYTFLQGTAEALANHSGRTAELEAEFLRRFPDRVVEAEGKLSAYSPPTPG
jgi:Family of unknown function (DUF6158)